MMGCAALCVAMFFALLATSVRAAEPQSQPPERHIFIAPSSTTISLGKVSLIVGPLSHSGKNFTGEYQVKVVPYFFKNESGSLELEAADEMEQKLTKGVAVEFTGRATNKKNGKTKVIAGKVTPLANDHGNVTISIETKHGMLVFNTTYHFGE